MVAGTEAALRSFEQRMTHRLAWTYEDILADEAGFLDGFHRFLFGEDGGFAGTPLEPVKLTPVHTGEKARMRARLTELLSTPHSGEQPAAVAGGAG